MPESFRFRLLDSAINKAKDKDKPKPKLLSVQDGSVFAECDFHGVESLVSFPARYMTINTTKDELKTLETIVDGENPGRRDRSRSRDRPEGTGYHRALSAETITDSMPASQA